MCKTISNKSVFIVLNCTIQSSLDFADAVTITCGFWEVNQPRSSNHFSPWLAILVPLLAAKKPLELTSRKVRIMETTNSKKTLNRE